MNLHCLHSLVLKEWHQLRRDRPTLRMFMIAPLMQLLMFGYAISTDLKNVTLGVVIEDPSPQARGLVQAIEATHAFILAKQSARPGDAERWLENGAAKVVLHIPPDFSRSLARGQTPAVQVLSDGSDSNTATLAFSYLNGAALQWASAERMERLRRVPGLGARLAGAPQIGVEPRFWYNPDLKSRNFQIPGVLGLVLMTIALSATSLLIAKERELGTLEQLSVTPVRAIELLIGKSVPVFVAGLWLTVNITLLAIFWFRIPLRGSLPFLLLSACLFTLCAIGIGLLVSVTARSQLQAQLVTSFITTPMVLLSGFMFPIANMPHWAQQLTKALPMRYYIEIVRGVFLKGHGARELWPQATALLVLGSAFYLSGVLLFRKRLD